MRASGIYSITNTVNGHRYVGSAVDVSARWGQHRRLLYLGSHHSQHLQRAWDKHGAGAFVFEVLDEWGGPESLISQEQWWINMLQPEYNTCHVANSCLGIRRSVETRAKMSAGSMGNQRWLGRKHTPETRAKMSAVQIGKHRPHACPTIETRASISAGLMGHVISPETRAKISAALAGKTQGRPWSQARWAAENARKEMSSG